MNKEKKIKIEDTFILQYKDLTADGTRSLLAIDRISRGYPYRVNDIFRAQTWRDIDIDAVLDYTKHFFNDFTVLKINSITYEEFETDTDELAKKRALNKLTDTERRLLGL